MPFPLIWMLLVGKSSLPVLAPLSGPPFWSETGPGARAFLVAVPSGPTRMEKVTFVAELRVRLGVPDAPPMSGAPVAMTCLTVSPSILVFVSLMENEYSGTTLSEIWSMLGLRKLA